MSTTARSTATSSGCGASSAGRRGVQRDRDALRRRVSLWRGLGERRRSAGRAGLAPAPDPRGQHLRASPSSPQHLLSRQLPHQPDRAPARAGALGNGDDRAPLSSIPERARQPALIVIGQDTGARLRVYAPTGQRIADSWTGVEPTYSLGDPVDEPWYRVFARWLDNGFDALVWAERPPLYVPPPTDTLETWPETLAAMRSGTPAVVLRRAPDGRPMSPRRSGSATAAPASCFRRSTPATCAMRCAASAARCC